MQRTSGSTERRPPSCSALPRRAAALRPSATRVAAICAVLFAGVPSAGAQGTGHGGPISVPPPLLPPLGPLPGFPGLLPEGLSPVAPPFEGTGLLTPQAPQHVQVAVGDADFVRFKCFGDPADAVLSLTTYSLNADPLMLVSLDKHIMPSFHGHDASSLEQWREDAPGEHSIMVRGVGPQGGLLGILNLRHFAAEKLNGLLNIRCSIILIFDPLFWDHFRRENLCPMGFSQDMAVLCSGRGRCGMHGRCACNADFTGPACEHEQTDLVAAAEGSYPFRVERGHYRYFRVRVPLNFPGGFLKVTTASEVPIVVLIKSDERPTKSDFDLSNFDDWIEQRRRSTLKYRVLPGGAEEIIIVGPALPLEPGLEIPRLPMPRRLQVSPFGRPPPEDACPVDLGPPIPQDETCQSSMYRDCKKDCADCVKCNQVFVGLANGGDQQCANACEGCQSLSCTDILAHCAGDLDCRGPVAQRCKTECGGCMACLDSSDASCSGCGCCSNCFPVEARCARMRENGQPAPDSFVFVAVYNHRHFYNERSSISGSVHIELRNDTHFDQSMAPSSWIGDLYNPFHDLRSLDVTQRDIYPAGEQFLYNLNLGDSEHVEMDVRLYKDRLTLIHIDNMAEENVELRFVEGLDVTNVLSSTLAAPKTLFDFDRTHALMSGRVQIRARGKSIWCALFGRTDGRLKIAARTFAGATGSPTPVSFAVGCVFVALCGLVLMGVVYGGANQLEGGGHLTFASFLAGFWNSLRGTSAHTSTAPLTRADSMSGYADAQIDSRIEDQYLHRGGFGDDGI